MTAKTTEEMMTDCQTDAVVLAGMVEAIDLMHNEGGANWENAVTAVTIAALARARKLADDLDELRFHEFLQDFGRGMRGERREIVEGATQ